MKIRPLGDRVLVKRLESEKLSKGGIIIPDSAKEKPLEGMVVSAGPGKRDDNGKIAELSVKAGYRDSVEDGHYTFKAKLTGGDVATINLEILHNYEPEFLMAGESDPKVETADHD